MGACAGLSLAMDYPELVLSLLMLSPLPLREPQDVAEGRQEVYDCWAQAYENPNYIDEEALTDAVYGAVQLGFNNTTHGIISPIVSSAVPQATGHWRRDNLDEAYDILVGFFTKREPHCRENLMKVKCPILLVHSGADIAYPLEYLEELHASLKDANVDARITHIPNSPHFSCVTHPKQFNTILHDWIASNCGKGSLPPVPPSVTSPYEELLRSYQTPNSDSGSDNDSSY